MGTNFQTKVYVSTMQQEYRNIGEKISFEIA